MKHHAEYRDPEAAKRVLKRIHQSVDPSREYRFMEFCGGHTHAISRFGLHGLLPSNVRLIHGPGCPVCVLPIGRLDMAIALAMKPGVILCCYGDTLRVPGSEGNSLQKARASGADVRMVYSASEVLTIAEQSPSADVVFFAIGFETTTPPTAHLLLETQRRGLNQVSVLCNHVLTPAAIRAILEDSEQGPRLDGLVGPAHVSVVIGSSPYTPLASNFQMPIVIAGFEPLDILQAILMLIHQVNEDRHAVENEYTRAVVPEGNQRALMAMREVFETRESFEWRGLGSIADSGLRIRSSFASWDAESRYDLAYQAVADHKACECAAILRGQKEPLDCKIFGTACTPETPLGACMVSSEGACAAHFTYGRNLRNFR